MPIRREGVRNDGLEDPSASSSMRQMAEEMMRLALGESMRLTINAGNPFIQQLARQDPASPEVRELMLGVCNNAIIYNQELMTAQNARIFHDQFAVLLQRSLSYLGERAELQAERERFEKERQRREAVQNKPRATYPVLFLMTPFKDDYRTLEDALRRVVEDRWGCQLFLARDRQYDQRLLENVRAHMDQADLFLAEVSEQNPNVMFELGAVLHNDTGKPVVLLCRQSAGDVKPLLPADLRAFIYLNYPADGDVAALAEWLEDELKKDARLMEKLNDGGREHFLSARRLQELASGISVQLTEKQAEALAEAFPTVQRWKTVKPEAVAKAAGLRTGMAQDLIDELITKHA